MSVLPLLINRIVLGKVVLREPHIALKRDSSGVLNIADLLKREEDRKTPSVRKLVIENGRVIFGIRRRSPEGLLTSLENLNGRIYSPFWTQSPISTSRRPWWKKQTKPNWI